MNKNILKHSLATRFYYKNKFHKQEKGNCGQKEIESMWWTARSVVDNGCRNVVYRIVQFYDLEKFRNGNFMLSS